MNTPRNLCTAKVGDTITLTDEINVKLRDDSYSNKWIEYKAGTEFVVQDIVSDRCDDDFGVLIDGVFHPPRGVEMVYVVNIYSSSNATLIGRAFVDPRDTDAFRRPPKDSWVDPESEKVGIRVINHALRLGHVQAARDITRLYRRERVLKLLKDRAERRLKAARERAQMQSASSLQAVK